MSIATSTKPMREVSVLTVIPGDWDKYPDHYKVLCIVGEFTGAGKTVSFVDLVAAQTLLRCFDSAFAPSADLHVMASTRAIMSDLIKVGMAEQRPSGYLMTRKAADLLGDIFPNVGLATILGSSGLL